MVVRCIVQLHGTFRAIAPLDPAPFRSDGRHHRARPREDQPPPPRRAAPGGRLPRGLLADDPCRPRRLADDQARGAHGRGCPGLEGGDTLVTRALTAFVDAVGADRVPGGFHAVVTKQIPAGAGLGGGGPTRPPPCAGRIACPGRRSDRTSSRRSLRRSDRTCRSSSGRPVQLHGDEACNWHLAPRSPRSPSSSRTPAARSPPATSTRPTGRPVRSPHRAARVGRLPRGPRHAGRQRPRARRRAARARLPRPAPRARCAGRRRGVRHGVGIRGVRTLRRPRRRVRCGGLASGGGVVPGPTLSAS